LIGQSYLERGEPVVVVARWASFELLRNPEPAPALVISGAKLPMRNVAIRRADGSIVTRPFRGLRRAR
jgi:hypothetical protein